MAKIDASNKKDGLEDDKEEGKEHESEEEDVGNDDGDDDENEGDDDNDNDDENESDDGEDDENKSDDDDDEKDSDSNSDNEEEEKEDKEETKKEIEKDTITTKKRKRKTAVDELLEKKKEESAFVKQTKDFNKELKKRGVVYIARIPPRMTPTKIKSLLSTFGEISRVYLVEEDPTKRKRRNYYNDNDNNLGGSGIIGYKGGAAAGKNKKGGRKRYVEGWVEFQNKKIAKSVAMQLNNTRISNYKRDSHYDDLWNIKYLHKFKWSHLTEKVAYERRVKEQKLRIEMLQAKKENASYIHLLETSKKLDLIEQRQQRSGGNQNKDNNKISTTASDEINKQQQKQRQYPKHKRQKQIKPIHDGMDKATKRPLLSSLL